MENQSIKTNIVNLSNFQIGGKNNLTIFAGPNVLEEYEVCVDIAQTMKEICLKYNFNYVFKSSYFKPNRTDYGPKAHKGGYMGPGFKDGLKSLEKIKVNCDIPLVCDIHSVEEAKEAGEILDVIQIPAANCKHMDIILAAGSTGKVIKIKKGQWLSPWEMTNVVNQLYDNGYKKVLITERGNFFGYKNLVIDFKSIPILKSLGVPVILDCAHTVAFAEGNSHFLGEAREYIPYFARAGIANGVDGLFFEVHHSPSEALSNPNGTITLKALDKFLGSIFELANLSKSFRA